MITILISSKITINNLQKNAYILNGEEYWLTYRNINGALLPDVSQHTPGLLYYVTNTSGVQAQVNKYGDNQYMNNY